MRYLPVLLALAVAGCGSRVSMRVSDPTQPSHADKVCMLHTPAPSGVQFKAVSFLDTYMHHYGSAEYLLDEMANQARGVGANAVVAIESGQEFGYFPWRVMRPRAKGHAIRITDPFDCTKLGGQLR